MAEQAAPPAPAVSAPAADPAVQPQEPRRARPIPPGTAPGAPAPTPAAEAAAARERDEAGRFLPTDRADELSDLLFSDGADVAPEDRAVTDLDGNEPVRPKMRDPRGPKRPPRDAAQSSSLKGEGAGGEPGGVASPSGDAMTAGADPQSVPPAPDGQAAQISDDEAIRLVIEGQPAVFKNPAHLTQALRSLRGMYNAAEKARTALNTTAHANYAAAQAWKAEAERLARGGAAPADAYQGRSQAPGAAGQDAAGRQAATAISDATGAPEEQVAKAVNWDHYKLVKQEQGSEAAVLWATAQMVAAATSGVSQRIEEMQRPAAEAEAELAYGDAVGQQIANMREWADDSGRLLYPEFNDPAALEEIARVLTKIKQDGIMTPQAINSPRGIHTVMLTWRDWRNARGRPWSPSVVQAQAPSQSAANPAPDNGIAAAVASVQRTLTGRNAPARPANPYEAREHRIRGAIVDAGSNPHGDFPWAP